MSGYRGEDVQVKKITHAGQRPVTIAHPVHFVLGWAKNQTADINRPSGLVRTLHNT